MRGPADENDEGNQHPSQSLMDLAASLTMMAAQLRAISQRTSPDLGIGASSGSKHGAAKPLDRIRNAQTARDIYQLRRQRTAIFGEPALFGEPAWDIMLDLYIAAVDLKQISVSSACIASGTPPTTGLRWLGVLEKKGLIARTHDPMDQRRILVRLTSHGLAAMDRLLDRVGDRRIV